MDAALIRVSLSRYLCRPVVVVWSDKLWHGAILPDAHADDLEWVQAVDSAIDRLNDKPKVAVPDEVGTDALPLCEKDYMRPWPVSL